MNYITKKLNHSEISKISIISTIAFFLFAHGYRFSNLLFSHDSLNICEYKPDWEIGIGRFIQPVLYVLRGVLGAPWLFSIMAMFWMILSVLLFLKIFKIDILWMIVAVSGVMTCNNVITLSNATYIQWMDVYTLALFTAILAAKLLTVEENVSIKNIVLAAVLVTISMGLYQAYIGVTLGIIVFYYVLRLGEYDSEETIGSLFIGIVKACLSVLLGGILYLVSWKAILALTGINSQNYFGMDEGSSANGYFYALYRTYKNVAIFFRRPSLYNTGSAIGTNLIEAANVLANIFILMYIGILPIANYLKNSKKACKINLLLQYVLLIFLPFAVNFACFMTKGDEHDLMRYGMVMIYVYVLAQINIVSTKKIVVPQIILLVCISVVVWTNIVFSNQLYLKKSLQEEATNYKIGQLIQMIEEVSESANMKQPTKVIIAGNPGDNEYFSDIRGTDMLGGTGIFDSPITYGRTIGFYMNYMLGANMEVYLLDKDDNIYLVGDDETNWNPSNITNDELLDMPVFPNDGAVYEYNNYIIVKMSDTYMVY